MTLMKVLSKDVMQERNNQSELYINLNLYSYVNINANCREWQNSRILTPSLSQENILLINELGFQKVENQTKFTAGH